MRLPTTFLLAFTLCCIATGQPATAPQQTVITVLKDTDIDWIKDAPELRTHNDLTYLRRGQAVQRTIKLPAAPADQRDAQRIIARLVVEPVPVTHDGKLRPGDPWTRLGNVCLVLPPPVKAITQANAQTPDQDDGLEIELMRFITGFGGRSEFTADLTPYAPLLHDTVTLRVYISTYASPAWKVTLTLTYDATDVGQRRPIWAAPLFNEPSVTSQQNILRAQVNVPKGLEQPRIFITSTGHATDGSGGDEFITRTHILRIDGKEVARWRPWAEQGGQARESSPTSDRQVIDGRVLWSSDYDRAGWHPGTLVEPLRLPVPELTPGKHTVELEIVGIRPKDAKDHHGYWRTSAIVVADEPWPMPAESARPPSP